MKMGQCGRPASSNECIYCSCERGMQPDQYNQVAHMIKRGYSTTFVRDAVQQLPDGTYELFVKEPNDQPKA